MNNKPTAQIENKNIRALLLKKENVPLLEDLLDQKTQRFKPIQKLKNEGRLNFGNFVDAEELNELFPKIKGEVDSFLGTPSVDMPKFGYWSVLKPAILTVPLFVGYATSLNMGIRSMFSIFTEPNFDINTMSALGALGAASIFFYTFIKLHLSTKCDEYNIRFKSITVQKNKRACLIPTAGHEYAHHIQQRTIFKQTPLKHNLEKYSSFQEGQARGIEHYLSETYREREDNEAFLYNVLNTTVAEMKSAYIWMCEETGSPIRKSLLKIKSSIDYIEDRRKERINREPAPHTIGNSLFSIYAAKDGNRIYRDMIHSNFKFS